MKRETLEKGSTRLINFLAAALSFNLILEKLANTVCVLGKEVGLGFEMGIVTSLLTCPW